MVRAARGGSRAREFRIAIEAEISKIADHPFLHPLVYRRARMAVLPRFPYNLYYRVSDEEIVIASCVHQRRHPRHWRKRF